MDTYCICPSCKKHIKLSKKELNDYNNEEIVILACYDCGSIFDLQKGYHERNITIKNIKR